MPRLCLTIVFNIRFLLQFFSLSNFRFCPKQFHTCVTRNTNLGLGRPSATFYTLMPLNVLFQESQNVSIEHSIDLIKSLFTKNITRILTNILSLCGILKVSVFPQLCFHLISFNIILPLDRYLILIISYRTLSNNVMIWEGISTSMWRRLETL